MRLASKSLADLRLQYLDLYLVHWPFPNFHPPGCDVTSRSVDAKPYIHANYMKTWRQMEKLVDLGLVRHIGTSNMTIPKLNWCSRCADQAGSQRNGIASAFSAAGILQVCGGEWDSARRLLSIGSPGRPERDRTREDTAPTEDPVIVKIAQRHGVHPAVVCIKWAVQRGQTPIPFSTNPRNYLANLQGAAGDPLTETEMQEIAGIDRNCRLIKGQVFLWKDGQTWEDLWDPNGEITPP